MKVLMIHNYYQQRGGEDAAFEAECELLCQNGHQVERLLFHNKHIQSGLERLFTGINALFNPYSFLKVVHAIQRFSPDLIHVHNFFPLASPAVFVAAKWMKVPIVATLHNYRFVCANAVLFRENRICTICTQKQLPLEGIRYACYQDSRMRTAALVLMTSLHKMIGTLHRYVDRLIVLSQYEKTFLVNSSLKPNPSHLVIKPNFAFSPEEPYALVSSDKKYFVFVGRLSPEKGVEALLNAFENTDIPLKIIGTGPLESKVKDVCSRSRNIEHLGYQDKKSVYKHLRCAIALIFPSVLPETFGLSVIEAFSVGTPVITYPLGGPGELVAHEVNGLHAELNSAQSLKNAANRLLGDPDLCKQLSQQAILSYQSKYTPQKNYEQLIEIYQNLLDQKRYA